MQVFCTWIGSFTSTWPLHSTWHLWWVIFIPALTPVPAEYSTPSAVSAKAYLITSQKNAVQNTLRNVLLHPRHFLIGRFESCLLLHIYQVALKRWNQISQRIIWVNVKWLLYSQDGAPLTNACQCGDYTFHHCRFCSHMI